MAAPPFFVLSVPAKLSHALQSLPLMSSQDPVSSDSPLPIYTWRVGLPCSGGPQLSHTPGTDLVSFPILSSSISFSFSSPPYVRIPDASNRSVHMNIDHTLSSAIPSCIPQSASNPEVPKMFPRSSVYTHLLICLFIYF